MKLLQYAAVATALVAAACAADGRQPQYVFAHRVNSNEGAAAAVAAGANIECDVTWDTVRDLWAVQHNKLLPQGPPLAEWLARLAPRAKNAGSFSVLWLDVKTPDAADLRDVVAMVQRYFPADIDVIFEFAADDILENAKGYRLIKAALATETNLGIGVTFARGEGGDVPAVQAQLARDGIQRSVATCGDSVLNLRGTLAEINARNAPHSTYGFKQVFTWTNKLGSTMADYIDPSQPHRTDGQIVGEFIREWSATGDADFVARFRAAVQKYGATQRLAVRNGAHTDSVWTPAPALKTYSVTVKTGTRRGAGTDSNISLTVIGDQGSTRAIKLNPLLSGNAFENGDTDRLTFDERNVGNIKSLRVTSDGRNPGSDWHLDYIVVNSKRASFNRWIEEGTYTKAVQ